MTPDGKAVPSTSSDDPNPRPYLRTPFDEERPRFSPEPSPRWVSYESNESGRSEVYVAAFPDPRNKIRISRSGGLYPQWGANGRELFYVAPGNKLMAVDLKLAPDSVEPSAPRELFVLPIALDLYSPYDAARPGPSGSSATHCHPQLARAIEDRRAGTLTTGAQRPGQGARFRP